MTETSLPWNEITRPSKDYNVRRVADVTEVNAYWGKNTDGQCLFLLHLNGDFREIYKSESLNVRGINIDLRQIGRAENQQTLIITLVNQVDQDLFYSLCSTLASKITGIKDSLSVFTITIAHLKRWKSFLTAKRGRGLSLEEIRGLFAELIFLQTLMNQLSIHDAINSWCGPERIHHDFIFGDTAIEVKAISGRERNSVRISSEDQLETDLGRLYLTVYRLGDDKSSENARSLNQLTETIEQKITDPDLQVEFFSRLAEAGYIESPEYDQPLLLVYSNQTYEVKDGFPRLVRSTLPPGVVKTSYDIQLEKLTPFECQQNRIWNS